MGSEREKVPSSTTTAEDAVGAIRLVLELLSDWAGISSDEVRAVPIVGGITNKTFRVVHDGPSGECRTVLVRIFGAEGVISEDERARENDIFAQLGERGVAPRLLALFGNGRIEQWIYARRATLDDMGSVDLMLNVAREMAALHAFCPADELDTQRKSSVWDAIEAWLVRGRALGISPDVVNVSEISREVAELKKEVERSPPSPLVFAHNDLLYGNILVGEKAHLIDFEYASTNFRGFDIGNFFCEAMGGTDDGIVQPDRYPSTEKQSLFCEEYLRSCSGHEPSPAEVVGLTSEANQFGLLASLYWAAWAVAQSGSSTVDFPYLLFARNRLEVYFKTKSKYFVRSS